jgi:hypothetical protein
MMKYADVGVVPVGGLQQTAELLGEVLGGIAFVEDTDGIFDEYPAFIAVVGDHQYSLLGPPAPEDDVRDEPNSDFQLKVEPLSYAEGEMNVDVADEIISRITSDGRVQCYSLD